MFGALYYSVVRNQEMNEKKTFEIEKKVEIKESKVLLG
jgi:hypothetical protein